MTIRYGIEPVANWADEELQRERIKFADRIKNDTSIRLYARLAGQIRLGGKRESEFVAKQHKVVWC